MTRDREYGREVNVFIAPRIQTVGGQPNSLKNAFVAGTPLSADVFCKTHGFDHAVETEMYFPDINGWYTKQINPNDYNEDCNCCSFRGDGVCGYDTDGNPSECGWYTNYGPQNAFS